MKLLRPELCEDEDVRARFLDEARALIRFSHPNVVQVRQRRRVRRPPLPRDGLSSGATELHRGHAQGGAAGRGTEGAGDLIKQILAGLEAAHAAGIVHRDLKPSNILVEKNARRPREGQASSTSDLSKFSAIDGVEGGPPLDHGHDRRHACLHVARADQGREGHRRPQRPLRRRHHLHGDAAGSSPLSRRERHRRGRQAAARPHSADRRETRQRDQHRDARRSRARAGARPRRTLRLRRRVLPGARGARPAVGHFARHHGIGGPGGVGPARGRQGRRGLLAEGPLEGVRRDPGPARPRRRSAAPSRSWPPSC